MGCISAAWAAIYKTDVTCMGLSHEQSFPVQHISVRNSIAYRGYGVVAAWCDVPAGQCFPQYRNYLY